MQVEKFRSVAGTLGLAFIFVVAIIAWFLGQDIHRAVQAYRNAQLASQLNHAANDLIAGVYDVLLERLETNNALQASEPAEPDSLKEIKDRRRAATDKISAALIALNSLQTNETSAEKALINDLATARDRGQIYRANADLAVAQNKAQRDADTVKNLYPALTEMTISAQKVWAAILAQTTALDPELARLSNLRILAWNLRETAGYERSHIAQSIAAIEPIAPDKLIAIREVRATVALMWRLLQFNIRKTDSPAVINGLGLAEDGYFGKFQPLANRMVEISENGANYPMSSKAWVDVTTPLLHTLLDIMFGAAEASEAHTTETERAAIMDLAWLGIAILVCGAAAASVALIVMRRIAGPLRELSDAIDKLTDADAIPIPHVHRSDEIGLMARAMHSFRKSFLTVEALRLEQSATQEAHRARAQQLSVLTSEFEARVGSIVDAVSSAATHLAASADEMSATAEEGEATANSVAQAAEAASANVQTVAASTAELSASINEISRQLDYSAQITDSARAHVTSSKAHVGALELSTSSIGSIVKLISAIANHTNLLALNATIEAARAGEAGRGFAVVASEVKSLAAQTAKATHEVSTQIASVQAATAQVVGSFDSIGETIEKVNSIALLVASAVIEQSAVTKDIGHNIRQTAAGTHEAATRIVEVRDAATRTGHMAVGLKRAAAVLETQSKDLAGDVQRFLTSARAI
ncbi:MAG: hypothetical protein QOI40_3670 [Alphaproteobacteria bacterium]|nr:hypothetical protein [Alphaproteobacteria bacterium]